MENEKNLSDPAFVEQNATFPSIYSKKAIWGFSFVFSAVFGGVLLMQNLKDIGKKKEAYMMLFLSIIFTAVTIFIVNIPEKPNSSFTYICNAIGGYILSNYFFNKYIPDEDQYKNKKIWKPLIISIIITIPIVMGMIYSLQHGL